MEGAICPRIADVPDGVLLIETFRCAADGVTRGADHLARLVRSAAALGFALDADAVRVALADLAPAEPSRGRLTLTKNGDFELTTAALPPVKSRWTFAIHPTRLAADDVWLQHKTTRRGLYDQARADLPQGVDEWVFLNERDEVCEGTISNIEVTLATGEIVTPPLSSGCLPGVFRHNRLATGQVHERVVSLADLAGARDIRLMNSLRGAIRAHWSPECKLRDNR